MDIALGSLILIVILLPGISFRKGFFAGEFSNQYVSKDIFQLFTNTLFPSIFIYILFIPVILRFGFYYDFEILFGTLSSNEVLNAYSINKINQFRGEIIFFQLFINLFAFLAGILLRNCILKYSYDAKNHFVRYKNIWHYLLSAKFMLFEKSQIELTENNIRDIDITFIDALVLVGDIGYLYTGILVDYQLSGDGDLDLLYIKNAQRKIMGKSTEFKDINGNVLALKNENILNLNLSFIQIIEEENKLEFKLIT